jgi:hypothetical protein
MSSMASRCRTTAAKTRKPHIDDGAVGALGTHGSRMLSTRLPALRREGDLCIDPLTQLMIEAPPSSPWALSTVAECRCMRIKPLPLHLWAVLHSQTAPRASCPRTFPRGMLREQELRETIDGK